MGAEAGLGHVLAAGAVGLALSVWLESFVLPQPRLKRSFGAWCAHTGLWCAAYGILLLLLGRPWCALVAVSAMLLTVVLVSNAKRASLREPFLFQDYDYFFDALRYPRLFLPFLGVKKFCMAVAFFALALSGMMFESPLPDRFVPHGQLGGILVIMVFAFLLLGRAKANSLSICLDPEEDMQNLGLLASLYAYAMAGRTLPVVTSPWQRVPEGIRQALPHLVAVQSESFFDVRGLYAGIRPDILTSFDRLRAESCMYGALSVPAWGANTVRTEFAFLTGIPECRMGVHRFNPYRTVLRGWAVQALPGYLKKLGYRTVCIHPYLAGFYGRDRVLRQLGFDAFIDIRDFVEARREGAFVADMEVGERIAQSLQRADSPTFVFAITMENHGPLHLERVHHGDVENLYLFPPPAGCDELTIYLRHLRNADRMIDNLRESLTRMNHPVGLCWYGDHVPIMPSTYTALSTPSGDVPYVVWWHNNHAMQSGDARKNARTDTATGRPGLPRAAHKLAQTWLEFLTVKNYS